MSQASATWRRHRRHPSAAPAPCEGDGDCREGIACIHPNGDDGPGFCDVDEIVDDEPYRVPLLRLHGRFRMPGRSHSPGEPAFLRCRGSHCRMIPSTG